MARVYFCMEPMCNSPVRHSRESAMRLQVMQGFPLSGYTCTWCKRRPRFFLHLQVIQEASSYLSARNPSSFIFSMDRLDQTHHGQCPEWVH
mmetsp:Transcript_18461/g.29970  ORF Transcript_18461/g.29970 Transcript_18461/m.29970 type:complete len:91 (-) Transcript_18461:10-282(-)